VLKLFKTNQRNSLSIQSLEGLLLLHQKFAGSEKIQIIKKAIQLFLEMREEMNQRKSQRSQLKRLYSKREEEGEEKDNNLQEEADKGTEEFIKEYKKPKLDRQKPSPQNDGMSIEKENFLKTIKALLKRLKKLKRI